MSPSLNGTYSPHEYEMECEIVGARISACVIFPRHNPCWSEYPSEFLYVDILRDTQQVDV